MTEEEKIVTLVDEDGEQFDFEILDLFRVDEVHYAILVPVEGNELTEEQEDPHDAAHDAESAAAVDDNGLKDFDEVADVGEAIIFRVAEGENGETILHIIDDEEEWDRVAGVAYERLLSGEEE